MTVAILIVSSALWACVHLPPQVRIVSATSKSASPILTVTVRGDELDLDALDLQLSELAAHGGCGGD